MTIFFEKLKKVDEPKWEKFVSDHKLATMYHLLGWREVIKKTYKLKDFYLVAKEGKKIVGLFPSFLIKNPLKPNKIISLPYCNYGGSISINNKINHLFVKFLKTKYQIKEIEIRSLQDEYQLPFKKGYVTSILDLNKNLEEIWSNLDKKLRNQIRKAEKYKIDFKSGLNLINDFYPLYSQTMKRLGTPCHGKKFFTEITKQFAEQSNIFMIYFQKKPIAGLFSFNFNKVFSDPWAASDSNFFYLCPNDFLYWETIKWAHQNNFLFFDFGRSTQNSGVHKFKKQWGTKTVPLYYYSLSDKKIKRKFIQAEKIFTKYWSSLPLFTTNRLGPILRKYIT